MAKRSDKRNYQPESGCYYPPGMTKMIAKDIVRGIKNGATPKMACAGAGVSVAKFEKWFARGQLISVKLADGSGHENLLESEDNICHIFFQMVTSAMAQAATACANHLRKDPDWRAQAWRMEKLYARYLEPLVEDKPIGGEGDTKVVIYIPDNGRSTKK